MDGARARRFQHVRELGDELVIVDEVNELAHRLDAVAARVWKACDGRSGVATIAAGAGVEEPLADELLGRLADLGLLEPAAASAMHTRRGMLRKTVLTGVAVGAGLPMISSIVLPTAAQAFSSQGMGPRESAPPGSGAAPAESSWPAGASGPAAPGATHASSTGAGRHVAVRGTSRSSRTSRPSTRRPGAKTTSTPGGSGGAGAGTGGRGGASSGRPLAAGSLPFTGSRVVQSVAAGTGLIAAGLAMRRVAVRREPPPA